MKNKKIIAMITGIALVGSSVATVFATTGTSLESVVQTISDTIVKKEVNMEPEATNNLEIQPKKEKVIMVDSQEKNLIFSETTKIINGQEKLIKSKSNFAGGELATLMESGCSIKDILKADAASSRIFEKPGKLLKRIKDEKITMDVLENKIKKERRDKYFKELKEKYPAMIKETFSKENLSEEDVYTVLAFLDTNEVNSPKDLIKAYKKDKNAALRSFKKAKMIAPSKETLAKYGLTIEEAKGFTDKQIETLANASSKKKLSLKAVIKRINTQKQ
ncbi:MAG: hypothetical protein ACM3UU_11810 [Ignavibacteriales bacterium]